MTPLKNLVTSNHRMSAFSYSIMKFRRAVYSKGVSIPFLSSDAFASIVDYYPYGQQGSDPVDSKELARARSLFVNSDQLVRLLEEHGSQVSAQVLITGNGDTNWNRAPVLPPSVTLWLAQNSSMSEPSIKTLPIGLENLRLGQRGLPSYFTRGGGARVENRVLVPPMSDTNPIRSRVVEEAAQRPDIFDVRTQYMSTPKYFRLARKFRFVLCVEGNGSDTHRVWETLYFGNFPILLSTSWSRSLGYLELPILVVDSLSDVTREVLLQFSRQYRTFNPAQAEPLWIPFWQSMIASFSVPD